MTTTNYKFTFTSNTAYNSTYYAPTKTAAILKYLMLTNKLCVSQTGETCTVEDLTMCCDCEEFNNNFGNVSKQLITQLANKVVNKHKVYSVTL